MKIPKCLVYAFAVAVSVNASAANDKWVTLKGRVVCEGDPPAAREINVTADPKHCLEKGKLFDETWIVNKTNKGVRNVFVWLASDAATSSGKDLPVHESLKTPAKSNVEINQPCCAFVPRVVGLREGQSLLVKNDAPVAHNVRWEGSPLKNPAGNETIVTGKSVTIANLKPDRFPVNISCSIHPWMKAVVRVFDHPYFAVTDENGNFEIKLAPVGKYRLFVWHEGCGWKGGAAGRNGEAVEIKPGSVQDLGIHPIKP